MEIVIKLNLDNAAFEDNALYEVLRIINAIKEDDFYRSLTHQQTISLRCLNGNTVGYYKILKND